MKSLNKQNKSLIVVGIILAILYTVCVLVIPFKKIAGSWIVFAFTLVSMGVCGYSFMIAFEDDKPLISKAYGFPLFRIGYIYFGVQFVFSVLILVISHFYDLPYWVSLIGSLIFLSFAIVGLIAVDNVKTIVEEMEEVAQADVKKVTLFKVNLESIVDYCNDSNMKKNLHKLAEKFKYSDPVSSEETMELEEKLTLEIEVLKDLVLQNKMDDILLQINKLDTLLTERNRICKAFKK